METADPVYLVYYRYDDDRSRAHPKWWLNWLTSKITGSAYIHVEIAFSNGDVYGIVPGQPISRVNDKSYRRNMYTCQVLYTSQRQSQFMREFLERRMARPSSFNYRGFYLLPWWPRSGSETNKFFCSELVACSMAAAGLCFGNIPPHTISPGELFELVLQFQFGGISRMLNSENKPLVV